MPGFNGTGPLGQGPLTGRGRGYCMVPADNNPGVPYRISGTQDYPVNALYPYQPMYGRSYSLPHQYPAYTGRSSTYLGFSRGRGIGRAFPRGRGIGRAFPGGAGMRGRGRRF